MSQPRNIYDFLTQFPPHALRENDSQYNSPCPWCTSGDAITYKDRKFYGTDRMVWWKSGDVERAFCRICSSEGRGRNGSGIYFFDDFADLFGDDLELDPNRPYFELSYDPDEGDDESIPILIDGKRRLVFHDHVDTAFWVGLGFTDETIKHFDLGWGRLYASWERGHVIPMKVRTATREHLAGDYYEVRIPYTDESGRQRFEKKNTKGSKKHVFWHVHEGDVDDGVIITESPKNVLALWQMGYRNIIATFGAGVWSRSDKNFAFLKDFGYTRMYTVGDNDQAGAGFNAMLIQQAVKHGLECYFLEWVGGLVGGYDVADLLLDRGAENSLSYLNTHFMSYTIEAGELPVPKAEFIPDYRVIDPLYSPRRIVPLTIEEVRGDGERSLNHTIEQFLTNYRDTRVYGRGSLLLLSVRPGAGKTHSLIQHAERIAKSSLQRRFQELHQLEQEILRVRQELVDSEDPEASELLREDLKRLSRQHEEFSFQSVLWSAQYRDALTNLIATGADMRYYFDFQARSAENCENYTMATRLATQGHNLMRFCEESCPFAARCKQRGYLAQYETRRQYPIGVHRHEHLMVDSAVEGYHDLVVIDESPLRIVEAPVVVTAEECAPTSASWENYMEDAAQVEAMHLFATSTQHAIRFNHGEPQRNEDGSTNDRYSVSGIEFLRLLDSTVKHLSNGGWTLASVIELLDERAVKHYQPNYIGTDLSEVFPIRLPYVFTAVERELPVYLANPTDAPPSCLHLVGGKLEVFPMERIHISSNVPVVVADATAMMPELYETAFGRDLEIYEPPVYNPNVEVTAVYGSDWTISSIQKSLGAAVSKRVPTIVDAEGKTISLEHLWEDARLMENPLVKAYLDAIISYAIRHREGGLLVVLHKRIRPVIEPIVRAKLPRHRVAFAHYGSVRGSNQWKDYEAVLLMGTPRIPYDVIWRRIQAWAFMRGIAEPIPFDLVYTPSPYDGTEQGHTHITFSHPFAAKFVDQIEMGEAIQAQERIRPHSSDAHKFIYLWSSRPIGSQITRIEPKRKILRSADPDSKANAIADYIIARLQETGQQPSKREVMRSFACRLTTADTGFELAKERLA